MWRYLLIPVPGLVSLIVGRDDTILFAVFGIPAGYIFGLIGMFCAPLLGAICLACTFTVHAAIFIDDVRARR